MFQPRRYLKLAISLTVLCGIIDFYVQNGGRHLKVTSQVNLNCQISASEAHLGGWMSSPLASDGQQWLPQRVSLWPRLHGTSASASHQVQLPPTTHSGETQVVRACKAIEQFCASATSHFRWLDSDDQSLISILIGQGVVSPKCL